MRPIFTILNGGLLIILFVSTSFSEVVRTTFNGSTITGQTVDRTLSNAIFTGIPSFASGDILTLSDNATRGGVLSWGGNPYTLTITSDNDTVRTITPGAGETGAFFSDVQGSTFHLNRVTFDGNSILAGFQTTSHDSGMVTIHARDVIFQNLRKDFGGAVFARTTTLTGNSLFSGTQADGSGGAIYNYDGVTRIQGNHTFLNNRANRGAAVYNQLGEVYVSGNVSFLKNTAVEKGVAIDASWGEQGNVFLGEDSQVSRLIFQENTASGLSGTTIYALNSVNIRGAETSIVFQDNETRQGNGGAMVAGKSMTFSNGSSIFTGNRAWDDDGANTGWGGALYIPGDGGLTLSNNNSLFQDNSATKSGGAIESDYRVSITRGTHLFLGNSAGLYGGAISTWHANSSISFSGADTSVTFSGNTAGGTPNDIGSQNGVAVTIQDSGNYTFGGGINSTSLTISQGAHVTLGAGSQNSVGVLTLANADLKVYLGKATDTGGFETMLATTSLSLKSSAIRFIVDEAFTGTRTALTTQSMPAFLQKPIVTLASGLSGLAYATKTNDGYNIAIQAEETGKTVYQSNGTTFTSGTNLGSVGAPGELETVWVTGNVPAGNTINFTGRNVTYQSNTEDVRTVTLSTSRLFLAGNITLNVANLHFQGGEIPISGNGGFLYNSGGQDQPVVFYGDNVTFSNIVTHGEGGVFFSSGDGNNLTLYGTNTFDSNHATAQSGGVISVAAGSFTMYGTNIFRNNKALYAGGAIYAREDIFISGNSLFENNESTENYGGGAIRSNYGNITLSGVQTFIGNKTTGTGADEHGGAILLGSASKTLTLSGISLFQNNTATKNGGAIYSEGNLVLEGDGSSAWFSGNYDQNGASDIFVRGTTTIRDNGTYYFGTGTWTNVYLVTDGTTVTYGANSQNHTDNLTISNNAQVLFAATPVENGFGSFATLNNAPTVETGGRLAAEVHGFTVLAQNSYKILPVASTSLDYSTDLFDLSTDNGTTLTLKAETGFGGTFGSVGVDRLLGVDFENGMTLVENYQLWVDTPYTDMFADWLGLVTGLETTGENGRVQVDLGTFLELGDSGRFVWDFSGFEEAYGYTAKLLRAGVNDSQAVPEPSTLLLLLAGVLILWRRKK
ncbi:MAG: PEP-CTERM sorting domain-containing protein [Planctomycetia bacterium]|nr:PEP-CTERM sorting domain-containing protein [Planctomycetia bacterium]